MKYLYVYTPRAEEKMKIELFMSGLLKANPRLKKKKKLWLVVSRKLYELTTIN